MWRVTIGLISSLVILAGTAVIVRTEGMAYRHSLPQRSGEMRARLISAAPTPALPVKEADLGRSPAPAHQATTRPRDPSPASEPPRGVSPVAESQAATKSVASVTPSLPPKVSIVPEPVNANRGHEPKDGREKAAAPTGIGSRAIALPLSTEDELEVGRELNALVLRSYPEFKDEEMRIRMLDAARPLLALRQRKEVEYAFFLIDSDGVASFSHPGGYVYISRGVFYLAADPAELQFLIAHEMAHVDLRHAELAVERARQGQLGSDTGLVPMFYRNMTTRPTVADEHAADDWAFDRLLKLGRTPHRSRGFLRRMVGFAESRARGGRKAGAADPEVGDIEAHWGSASSAADRLGRLGARSAANQAGSGATKRP